MRLSLFAGLLVVLIGCSESGITQPPPPERSGVSPALQFDAEGLILLNAGPVTKDGKVELCHFPPGDPGNPQKLSLTPQAAEKHAAHKLDGFVGEDYDENCEKNGPLVWICHGENHATTETSLDIAFGDWIIWHTPDRSTEGHYPNTNQWMYCQNKGGNLIQVPDNKACGEHGAVDAHDTTDAC